MPDFHQTKARPQPQPSALLGSASADAMATAHPNLRALDVEPKSPTVLLVSTEDARRQLGGLGKTTLFSLISDGEFETVLVGRRRMIVAKSLAAFVERLREQARAEAA